MTEPDTTPAGWTPLDSCTVQTLSAWEDGEHRLLWGARPIPDQTNTDRDLAAACREWIKGCTCAPAARPQDCQECTAGFLDAVLKRAQAHGLAIGSNALSFNA